MNKQFPTQLASAVYRVTELFPQNEPLRYKIREIADEILADFAVFQNLEARDAETEQGFLRGNQVKNQIFSKIDILNNYYFDLAREQAWVNPLNFLILKQEYDKMKSDIETRLSQIKLPETEEAPAISPGRGNSELNSGIAASGSTPPRNDNIRGSRASSLRGALLGDAEISPEQPVEPEQPEIEPIEPEQPLEPELEPEPELPKIIEPETKGAPSSVDFAEPEPEPEPESKELSARHKEILKIIEQGNKKQVGEIRKSFPSLSKRTLRRDLEFLLKQGYVDRVGQWNEVSYQIKRTANNGQ